MSVDATPRPKARPKPPKMPSGISWQTYYADTDGGPIVAHDAAAPVRLSDHRPVGVWWHCPAEEGCDLGEIVFSDLDPYAQPSQKGCPEHVLRLVSSAEDTPGTDVAVASGTLRERAVAKVSGAVIARREAARAAAVIRVARMRAAAAEEARRVSGDLREHVPSAAIGTAWLAGASLFLGSVPEAQAYIGGLTLASVGTVIFYLMAYAVQLMVRRYHDLGDRKRMKDRAAWIMMGPLLTGIWIIATQLVDARPGNWQGTVAILGGLLLVAVGNAKPWTEMRNRRRNEAIRIQLAAEKAARLEEERLAAEKREEAWVAMWDRALVENEEWDIWLSGRWDEALAEYQAWKDSQIRPEDAETVAGRKFAALWEKIKTDQDAAKWLKGTEVLAERTRRIQIPDPDDAAKLKTLGFEYWIKAKPGSLAGPAPGASSVVTAAHAWIADMIGVDLNEVTIIAKPEDDNGKAVPNHFVISLSRGVPYSAPVPYMGREGTYVGADGGLYGHVGRDLLGKPVYKPYWIPGQPGGGARSGYTGSGKTVVAQVDLLNMLYLGIFPMVHDGKELVDYSDWRGIIPLGCTDEHRDVFLAAGYAIMRRRQQWLRSMRRMNRHGIMAAIDPVWSLEYGAPLAQFWDEFHLHAPVKKFIGAMTSKTRLQRLSAVFDWVITQGGGVEDFGATTLRDQVTAMRIELMRMSALQANLTNYSGDYSPENLPRVPGMMVAQSAGQAPEPYRSAYVHRRDEDGSIMDHLWIPDPDAEGGARQHLVAPDLPPEDMEIFDRYGVTDIWNQATTEEGWDSLITENDSVLASITGEDAGLPARPRPGVLRDQSGLPKPEMKSVRVIAALLKMNSKGMTINQILESTWWEYVAGAWSDTASRRPDTATIWKAMKEPTPEQQLAGKPVLFLKDGKSEEGTADLYTLSEEGYAMAAEATKVLAAAGAPGLMTDEQRLAAEVDDGADVIEMEREAIARAEQEQLAAASVRAAMKKG